MPTWPGPGPPAEPMKPPPIPMKPMGRPRSRHRQLQAGQVVAVARPQAAVDLEVDCVEPELVGHVDELLGVHPQAGGPVQGYE